MALSIDIADIGKQLSLTHTNKDEGGTTLSTDTYLATLTLVHEEGSETTGYFSAPVEGSNIILKDGDTDWEYSVIE